MAANYTALQTTELIEALFAARDTQHDNRNIGPPVLLLSANCN
jgi:hypothetical protein